MIFYIVLFVILYAVSVYGLIDDLRDRSDITVSDILPLALFGLPLFLGIGMLIGNCVVRAITHVLGGGKNRVILHHKGRKVSV
jgi:hypothetical protein